MKDIVLCRIYKKAISHKSIEQRAKLDYIQREEPIVSGDGYEEKSHSTILQGSFQISNPLTKTRVSSLHYIENHDEICSSAPAKTNEEASLFECLEPIIFFEETMTMKNLKAYKPPQLELPKYSMDCLFR